MAAFIPGASPPLVSTATWFTSSEYTRGRPGRRSRYPAAGPCNSEPPMNIVAVKETVAGERRVPVTPQTAGRLVRLGAQVAVESGLGAPRSEERRAGEVAGETSPAH